MNELNSLAPETGASAGVAAALRRSDESPIFSVLAGNPTPAELAAVTAVIQALIEEEGENDRKRVQRGQSAWQQSQRAMRRPLHHGPGAWRGFSA
jgi:hypothetical protein